MDIAVFLHEEQIATIPYEHIVNFRLYCEHEGFTTAWDKKENRLNVYSQSKYTRIVLSSIAQSRFIHDSMEQLQQFLIADKRITVAKNVENASDQDFNLTFSITETKREQLFLTIEHHPHIDDRLRNIIISELNKAEFGFQLKALKSIPANQLSVICHLPEPIAEFDEQSEQLSMCFAAIMIRHLDVTNVNRLFHFAHLTFENNRLPAANIEQATEETEQNKIVKHETSPAPQLLQTIVDDKSWNAEVFFDYSILPPQPNSETPEFLVNGNLLIKNTGTETLTNPVLCIKITPPQSATLSGQIIPPTLVSGLAMKSNGFDKGWKYVYDDWRHKIKESGESWIAPIHDVQIAAAQTLPFPFKLTINPNQKERTTIIINGFVYFQQGNQQYRSNNQISISF